jgi:hypothetical protein
LRVNGVNAQKKSKVVELQIGNITSSPKIINHLNIDQELSFLKEAQLRRRQNQQVIMKGVEDYRNQIEFGAQNIEVLIGARR